MEQKDFSLHVRTMFKLPEQKAELYKTFDGWRPRISVLLSSFPGLDPDPEDPK